MDDTLTYKDGIELLQTKGSKMLQTVCQFIYLLISLLTIEVYTDTYHELCTVDISLRRCTMWNIVINKNYLVPSVIILVPLYI